MKKSIINFRNTYFSMILIILFFVVLSWSFSIVGIVLFKNIFVFIITFVPGLALPFASLYLFFKTIYKVTFYEDKVVFSRFNKVYRVFHRDSFTQKNGLILKKGYTLVFQDDLSSNEKQVYEIEYNKRNKKILEDIYSLKDID